MRNPGGRDRRAEEMQRRANLRADPMILEDSGDDSGVRVNSVGIRIGSGLGNNRVGIGPAGIVRPRGVVVGFGVENLNEIQRS